MEVNQIKKLMTACGYFDYGMDKISLLEMSLERDSEFTLNGFKEEFNNVIDEKNFDWVKLALETEFVYSSEEVKPKKFDVDELLIFTDSFRWKDIVKADSLLSRNQIDDLKEQFREIDLQQIKNIKELFDHPNFSWLPFEVKHAYLLNFSKINYTDEDIVFYLKKIVWDYIYPNSLDLERLNSIKEQSILLLSNQNSNEGWVEMFELVQSLLKLFPNLDLYELSRVDWGKDVQYKNHYRNPFTLGYKRINPESESKY